MLHIDIEYKNFIIKNNLKIFITIILDIYYFKLNNIILKLDI